MALSSNPALNWPVVPYQSHGRFITSPQAAVEAPHLLTATAFPTYSNFNGSASCTYSVVNSKRFDEAGKANPPFFSECCWEYNICQDDELIDGQSYASCQDYCNNYNTYTYDMLNPAAAAYLIPTADTPLLSSCYEFSDYHQQQLSSESGFLSFPDNYGMNLNQFYHCQARPQPPKRHKPCYIDHPDPLISPNNLDSTVQFPGMQDNGISSNMSNFEDMEHTRPRTRRVSAQSLAARERRKKITDKTHELGRLIPGGSKMNTAEMLQSAFKYVKFLQSQVHILQLMSSLNYGQVPKTACRVQETDCLEEEREEMETPYMLRVVASPVVQEKLYKYASCIIPHSLAEILIHHYPHLEELHQLL